MKPMLRLIPLLPLFLLTACPPGSPPPVVITYHQVGACNGYQNQYGLVAAGTNQAYVVFGIESINNSQGTTAFAFDPTKLYVSSVKQDFVDPNLQFSHDILGPFAAVPTTVAAGQNLGFQVSAYGAVVVQTANPNGAAEANNTSYFLNYQTPPGSPPVTLVKSDSSQTSWPDTEDCHTLSLH